MDKHGKHRLSDSAHDCFLMWRGEEQVAEAKMDHG